MKNTYQVTLLCLIMLATIACKKTDYLIPAKEYARIEFKNNSVLGNDIGVKYNGKPLAGLDGKVYAGIGKFTFYNKTTGDILLEKDLDVKASDREPWYLFQPDASIPPQLIRNTQKDEPAAPEGYMKIKFANLSKIALTDDAGVPYKKIDIILKSTLANAIRYAAYDTIYIVGSNLDTAQYYLVKKALRNGTTTVQQNYKFSFLDHETHREILNSGGTIYESTVFSAPLTGNNVYTLFFTDLEQTQNSVNILKDNKYYRVQFTSLFE